MAWEVTRISIKGEISIVKIEVKWNPILDKKKDRSKLSAYHICEIDNLIKFWSNFKINM